NQRNFIRGNVAAGNGGAHIRVGNVNAGQGKPIKCFNCNGLGHIAWNYTQLKRQQNSDYFKDKIPTNQQDGPSNASILSEVHDLENAIDPCDDNKDEHDIHNEVQQKNIIDSTKDRMGNSNVTLYEQYLSVNDVSVVPSCTSSVLNNAYVLHDNDAYVPHDPLVTELNIYKEQVAIYEQRAKFELTLRKQKMDEQMSILIRDRNQKEENLKKEIHSRNNKVVQHGYLNHLRDTLDTLREIVKEAKSKRPSDNNLDYAYVYTKRSQELLENMSASCLKVDNKRDTIIATRPATRKRHVTFADPLETSGNNSPKIVKQQTMQKTNILIPHFT
nr:hypothetical protein [Tanacetum cinerariifolium]